MNSDETRKIYLEYSPAVAYIEVVDGLGDIGIGSGFHVGNGVFVTARHVVEDKIISKIGCNLGLVGYSSSASGDSGDTPENLRRRGIYGDQRLSLKSGPFFPSDQHIDVAIFACDGLHPDAPWIPLGGHWDDVIGVHDFVLTHAVIMGYPPVPLTAAPHLISASAEVNAVVDLMLMPHPHFVLSAMPRGGFSGGVVFSEFGFLLGMITQGLVTMDKAAELGFFAALSIEPIYACLETHGLLPEFQEHDHD